MSIHERITDFNMKHRSIQSTITPKGYNGKDYNKWIAYIYRLVSKA